MKNLVEKTPLPGDVVVADRLLYKHYGIYIGNMRVVHFSGGAGGEINTSDAKIIETSLADFLEGSALYVEESDEAGAFPPDVVVKRALSMVGRLKGDYNLIFNNCEHFTHWCKFGIKKSNQVNGVLKAVAGVAAIALGLFLSKSNNKGLK